MPLFPIKFPWQRQAVSSEPGIEMVGNPMLRNRSDKNHLKTEVFSDVDQKQQFARELQSYARELERGIAEVKAEVASKSYFFPSRRRVQRQSLEYIDAISEALRDGSDSSMQRAESLLFEMRDEVGEVSATIMAHRGLEKLVTRYKEKTADHATRLQSYVRDEAASRSKDLRVSPVRVEAKVKANGVSGARLQAENIPGKLMQLLSNLEKQNYADLVKQGQVGGFLNEKISASEFAALKSALRLFVSNPENIKKVQEGMSRDGKGFFSLKKSAADLGEHDLALEDLPRSVVFTADGDELQMTILTKSKISSEAGITKGESAKVGGGKSNATRALCFTTDGISKDLKFATVIHKTKTGTNHMPMEEWVSEAGTDPVDRARRAPNGLLVADGGDALISKRGVINPRVKGNKFQTVQSMLAEGAGLESLHGDLTAVNILANFSGEVRIIDFPVPMEARLSEIAAATHFAPEMQGRALASISELKGQITDPNALSVIEGGTGLLFMNAGGMIMNQYTAQDVSDPAYLGFEAEADLSDFAKMADVSQSLYNAVYGNSALSQNSPLPRYNDSWALLNTARQLYEQGDLNMDEKVELEMIKIMQRDMLNDFVKFARDVDNVAEINRLNDRVRDAKSALGGFANILNNEGLDDTKKLASLKGEIKSALEFEGEVGDKAVLKEKLKLLQDSGKFTFSEEMSEAEFVTGVRDLMQEVIGEVDEAVMELGELVNSGTCAALTENMNKEWEPQALASKMGVVLVREQEQSKEQEQGQEVSEEKVSKIAKQIIAERESQNHGHDEGYESPTGVEDFEKSERKSLARKKSSLNAMKVNEQLKKSNTGQLR